METHNDALKLAWVPHPLPWDFNFDMGFPVGEADILHHRAKHIPGLWLREPEGEEPTGNVGVASPCQQGGWQIRNSNHEMQQYFMSWIDLLSLEILCKIYIFLVQIHSEPCREGNSERQISSLAKLTKSSTNPLYLYFTFRIKETNNMRTYWYSYKLVLSFLINIYSDTSLCSVLESLRSEDICDINDMKDHLL